jgi:hypothetical protein
MINGYTRVSKESEEKTLEETVQTALAQIEAKKYDAELLELGVSKEHNRLNRSDFTVCDFL